MVKKAHSSVYFLSCDALELGVYDANLQLKEKLSFTIAGRQRLVATFVTKGETKVSLDEKEAKVVLPMGYCSFVKLYTPSEKTFSEEVQENTPVSFVYWDEGYRDVVLSDEPPKWTPYESHSLLVGSEFFKDASLC